MIFAALFIAIAAAGEPPERPQRPQRYPLECNSAFGVTANERTPLVDEQGIVTCSGVVLPTSEAYYLQQIKAWADASIAFYEAKAAADTLQIAQAERAAHRSRRAAAAVITCSAVFVALSAVRGSSDIRTGLER